MFLNNEILLARIDWKMSSCLFFIVSTIFPHYSHDSCRVQKKGLVSPENSNTEHTFIPVSFIFYKKLKEKICQYGSSVGPMWADMLIKLLIKNNLGYFF